MTEASGVQAALACWWSIEAEFRQKSRRGWEEVRSAWEETLAIYRRVVVGWGTFDREHSITLASYLSNYANAAKAAGDLQLEEKLLREHREIRDCLNKQ